MSNVIKLNANDIKYIINESVKRMLSESPLKPVTTTQQIKKADRMQKTVGGSIPKEAEQYIGTLDNFYGQIARTAQANKLDYLTLLKDLQQKIRYYLQSGYFGQNQMVVDTIQKFTELLSFLYGLYQKEVKRQWKRRGMNEGLRDWWKNSWTDDENEYGVKQKVQDDSGSQYAVQQKNGQWMTDLQNELKQLLQWQFLFGPTTIEVTKQFINFLNVRQKTIMGWLFGSKAKQTMTNCLNNMKKGLIGVAVLGGIMGALSTDSTSGYGSAVPTQEPQTGVVAQQAQNIDVGFQINHSEMSQQDIQQLQQMSGYEGNISIIIHQSQNSSGKDASYEGQLVQQRANTIMQALGRENVNVQRGENVIGQPYAEIVFN